MLNTIPIEMSSTNDNNGETGATAESEPVASSSRGAGGGVKRRQYKKDTIYLYDLYTLTYDNNEQLESIEMFNTLENENVRIVSSVDRDSIMQTNSHTPPTHKNMFCVR